QRLVTTEKLGKTLVWDARSGKRLDEPPPKLAGFDSARSNDGQLFARIDDNVVRLIRAPDAEGQLIRRHRTGLDPEWHAAEAARCEPAGEWFAAAFHLRQCLVKDPDNAGLLVRRLRAATLAGLGDPKPLAQALAARPAQPPDAEELRLARTF